jgi:hypothetical protein
MEDDCTENCARRGINSGTVGLAGERRFARGANAHVSESRPFGKLRAG